MYSDKARINSKATNKKMLYAYITARTILSISSGHVKYSPHGHNSIKLFCCQLYECSSCGWTCQEQHILYNYCFSLMGIAALLTLINILSLLTVERLNICIYLQSCTAWIFLNFAALGELVSWVTYLLDSVNALEGVVVEQNILFSKPNVRSTLNKMMGAAICASQRIFFGRSRKEWSASLNLT